MTIPQTLEALGWKPFFAKQREDLDPDQAPARVAAHFGSQVLLVGESGEFRVPVQLAEAAGGVAVGDWLLLDHEGRSVFRFQRESLLHRKASGEEVKSQPIAANLDTIFVVTSCNEDFNLSRLERYLALVLQSGATPVVILTKSDLCSDPDSLKQQAQRLHPDLIAETLDARQVSQAQSLKAWCGPGQTVALVGSSGVGKSTLANALGAGQSNRVTGPLGTGADQSSASAGQLRTGAIREKDGKGRHTTTTRSLHRLSSGGVLIDNPGIRELQLPACEDGLSDLFEDVLAIAEGCRFSNCQHQGDLGCAIEQAIQSGELDQRRFNSYQKLNAEQEHHSRSLAERRERERKTGRFYKSVLKSKRRQRNDY